MSDLLDKIEIAIADALCKSCGHKRKYHHPAGCMQGWRGFPRTEDRQACSCKVFKPKEA